LRLVNPPPLLTPIPCTVEEARIRLAAPLGLPLHLCPAPIPCNGGGAEASPVR
jgi:hypothetical protein